VAGVFARRRILPRFWATAAFAITAAYDELWSGVTVVAAPAVEAFHQLDHAQYALWTFAVPLIVAAFIEAPIALASDRMSRGGVLASSLGMLAVSLAGCALAESAWMLAAGLSVAGAASGVACGAAQAELVTTYPGGPHRAMSRWIAFAAAGDALTPPLIAAALWAFGSYRGALWVLAVVLGLQALFSWWTAARAVSTGAAIASDDPDDAPVVPLRAAIARASSNRDLWIWLFAAASCTLLDEVVVALGALHLDRDRGWGTGAIAAAMTGFSSGGVLGALVCEHVLQFVAPRRLLITSTLGSLMFLAVFSYAPHPAVALGALFLLGVCASTHYPLVKATAFELAPGQPGVVNAISQLYVAVEVILPLAAGAIANRFGLVIALMMLAFEPLVVLTVAIATRDRRVTPPP
jgi:MFS family permease